MALNAVLLSIAILVLPAVALGSSLRSISDLWATPVMRELTLGLFPGPVMMLALSLLLFAMTLFRRHIPWWLVVIGMLGAKFSADLPDGIGHDFSHVIFGACSGYGRLVFWLCMGLGACILSLGEFQQLKPLVRRFHAWRLGEGLDESGAERRRD